MLRALTVAMNLDRTKELIQGGIDKSDPYGALVLVLESAIELVQIPENEFCWSYWEDANEAAKEISKLLSLAKSYTLPERVEVAVLFAPTGPLQEVSLSSGWAEPFLKVAEKYDEVERLLWPNS